MRAVLWSPAATKSWLADDSTNQPLGATEHPQEGAQRPHWLLLHRHHNPKSPRVTSLKSGKNFLLNQGKKG